MTMSRLLVLGFAAFAALCSARHSDGSDDDVAATSNSTSPSQTTRGDSHCTMYMCVTAVVNDTTVEYELSTTGAQKAGWLAMGFGTSMSDAAMVIMWANSDGTFTLSQRTASGEVMPTVDSNPPRVATAESTLSSSSGSDSKFFFTVDANDDTTQDIIYAIGIINPDSSSGNANLVQHLDSGAAQLDLTKTTSTGDSGSTGGSSGGDSSGGSGSGSSQPGLLPYQRLIVAHGIVCVVGFLFFLPFGSLLARYLRTFTPRWYTGHWISQFALGGPLVITGLALGVRSVSKAGASHLDDDHKRWGVAIVVLYFVQCCLGAIIHWFKPRSGKRPVQNYFHALLGILVIALAFYQVRTGFHEEWTKTTGRPALPNAVNIVWYVWVVLIPILYLAGLVFLRRQYRQEAEARTLNISK